MYKEVDVRMIKIAEILDFKGRDVVTCAEETPISDAAQLLLDHAIGVLVVTDSLGNVAGIFSERDIVRELVEAGRRSLNQPVAAAMNRSVITCSSNSSIDYAMKLMNANKIRHLPVVDNVNLAGIISTVDIVSTLLAEVEQKVEYHQKALKNAYAVNSVEPGKRSCRPIDV
jgi:CBS domain-containing protein